MKTTEKAASDYAEITNVLTGIPCSDVEEIFLSGAGFANRWMHVNEGLPPKELGTNNLSENVLIKMNVGTISNYAIACYDYFYKKWIYAISMEDLGDENKFVTHWKPIK